MALQVTLSLTAQNTPSSSNIIPGGTVTGAGATKDAALAVINNELENRKNTFQNQANTIQSVQDILA
jgi:hypothetical protein